MDDLVSNLQMLARGVQMLVLWLDCDREGVDVWICRKLLLLK